MPGACSRGSDTTRGRFSYGRPPDSAPGAPLSATTRRYETGNAGRIFTRSEVLHGSLVRRGRRTSRPRTPRCAASAVIGPCTFFDTAGPVCVDDHGDRWRGRLAIPRCGIAGALAGSQQEGHLVVIDRRAGAEDRQRVRGFLKQVPQGERSRTINLALREWVHRRRRRDAAAGMDRFGTSRRCSPSPPPGSSTGSGKTGTADTDGGASGRAGRFGHPEVGSAFFRRRIRRRAGTCTAGCRRRRRGQGPGAGAVGLRGRQHAGSAIPGSR